VIGVWGTAAVLIAPPAALFLNGYAPGNSLAAQHYDYVWNSITSEIDNVLSAASITPNGAVNNQLITAIQVLVLAGLAITGTAAILAANNPTPAKGQIAYETDRLSFKIGDGSTAYNSLTYFYRGLPVSGEPSLGTPHVTKDADRSSTFVVNTSTNAAGVWSAAVTMTGVPAGAKAAWCSCYLYLSGSYPALAVEAATGYTLSDITSGSNIYKYFCIRQLYSGVGFEGTIKIHLDVNGQFKWCTSNSNCTVQIGSAIDYEM
jgi:hypothetical protein